MSDCPKCKRVECIECIKDGIVGGRQRYRCKACGYRHTVAYKWYSEKDKKRGRATETGQCLWDGVAHHNINNVMTDYLVRHFLARLRRKSKCYVKSMNMLLYSFILLMLKWKGNLNVIFCYF
jgi:transposase-like protein